MFYPRCSHHLFLPPIPHLRIESLKHDSRKDAKAAKVTDRGPLFYDLSARASKFGGIVRPICSAVFKLINISNFVGNSVGTSAGLAPFRILSTCTGSRRSVYLIEKMPNYLINLSSLGDCHRSPCRLQIDMHHTAVY